MNRESRIRVAIGAGLPVRAGWLNMHHRDDAEAPFRLGEDFPFADDAVEIVDVCTIPSNTTCALRGEAVYLREPLPSFRIHAGQRQHDPTKTQRNVQNIGGLQDAWLRLELHTRMQPDRLRVRPFPYSAADEWHDERVAGMAARPIASLGGDEALNGVRA